MMKLHEQIRKESSEKYLDDSLEVGVPGLEPGKTGPESVVLPITPYPNLLNLDFNCRMLSHIMSEMLLERFR